MMAGKDSVVGSTTFMTKVQGVMNELLPETAKAGGAARCSFGRVRADEAGRSAK